MGKYNIIIIIIIIIIDKVSVVENHFTIQTFDAYKTTYRSCSVI